MTDTNSLLSISPVDGRYSSLTLQLRDYFSEFAFFKYRVTIELKYLQFLSSIKIVRKLSSTEIKLLEQIVKSFDTNDAQKIKIYEEETNHDVKAVEYFIKDKLEKTSLKDLLQYVHFGLTSEDVNNLALSLILKEFNAVVISSKLNDLLSILKNIATRYRKNVFLARTHGQPAVPTTFGKEVAIYYHRLQKVRDLIVSYKFEGKLNGAVGNFNALQQAYPSVDWIDKSQQFISSLGLMPNIFTTQILPGDNWLLFFDYITLVNNILIGLAQDMWMYISQSLLILEKVQSQVGSSTMPQKVNPIDFENAEGNLRVANSLLDLYEDRLSKSRMQRDLTDSTIKRTFGVAFGHTILAWKSLSRGLSKVRLDEEFSRNQIEGHYEILTEAVQTLLKKYGDEKGYEKMKDAVRGKTLTKKEYETLVKSLASKNPKINTVELLKLSPYTYLGLAEKLTELALKK